VGQPPTAQYLIDIFEHRRNKGGELFTIQKDWIRGGGGAKCLLGNAGLPASGENNGASPVCPRIPLRTLTNDLYPLLEITSAPVSPSGECKGMSRTSDLTYLWVKPQAHRL
jgi:hypothetical protein